MTITQVNLSDFNLVQKKVQNLLSENAFSFLEKKKY